MKRDFFFFSFAGKSSHKIYTLPTCLCTMESASLLQSGQELVFPSLVVGSHNGSQNVSEGVKGRSFLVFF